MDACGSRQATPNPRSYIVVTPDGTQMRPNRVHLHPTEEETLPATGPTWEPTNNESSPPEPSITDTGVKMKVKESQSDTSQAEQPVRRSQRIQRPPQRLIGTV